MYIGYGGLCPTIRVNMTSHPGMMEVPWYYVKVEPGDCLYLPFEWIHHVSSNFSFHVCVNVVLGVITWSQLWSQCLVE